MRSTTQPSGRPVQPSTIAREPVARRATTPPEGEMTSGTPRSGRPAPALLACGLSAMLVLWLGGAALASVVPATGRVARKGYAYYLERAWQVTFANSRPVKACQTVTVNGKRVGLLVLKTLAPEKESYTCGEPAGRPVYAVQPSDECSTFKGDHGKFGTTNSQLKKCARALFNAPRDTTTVDGQTVAVAKLVSTTGVYRVHVPKNGNVFESHKSGSGRSAAHGFGLLLTGFSKGTHVIHALESFGHYKWDITWTLRVH